MILAQSLTVTKLVIACTMGSYSLTCAIIAGKDAKISVFMKTNLLYLRLSFSIILANMPERFKRVMTSTARKAPIAEEGTNAGT